MTQLFFFLFLCHLECYGWFRWLMIALWLFAISAVHGHHVPSGLFDDAWFVYDRVCWGHGPHRKHVETDLL